MRRFSWIIGVSPNYTQVYPCEGGAKGGMGYGHELRKAATPRRWKR